MIGLAEKRVDLGCLSDCVPWNCTLSCCRSCFGAGDRNFSVKLPMYVPSSRSGEQLSLELVACTCASGLHLAQACMEAALWKCSAKGCWQCWGFCVCAPRDTVSSCLPAWGTLGRAFTSFFFFFFSFWVHTQIGGDLSLPFEHDYFPLHSFRVVNETWAGNDKDCSW